MSVPAGMGKPPLTQAEKAAKTVDRMKTETIHAQAMQLEYMRGRLVALEDEIKQLRKDKRSLELKLLSSQRIITGATPAPIVTPEVSK